MIVASYDFISFGVVVPMRNRFRFMILLLAFALLVPQRAMTAYAETEGAGEGGSVVTESGTLSSDNTLSSLKIAQAALSPAFSSNQLTYTATVPYEVERVALTAQTTFPGATKVIRGTSDLEVGENIITVTVTAEDGAVREYRITLVRQAMPESTAGENDETQDPTQTGEGGSSEDTSEAEDTAEDPTEESAEVTIEQTTEKTPQKETTAGNGGMVVDTTTEDSWNLDRLLRNPMFLIGVVGAIFLVLIFIIIAAVLVLREKRRGEDEDEDDEFDEELDVDGRVEVVVTDSDDDFEEIVEPDDVVEGIVEPDDVIEEIVKSDDDLDDDFEMLLEDDDDFDFLDF